MKFRRDSPRKVLSLLDIQEIRMEKENKPFSMAYVLKATAKHMRKSIDISIRKTNDRWPEFVEDEIKSKEVMKTLMVLHNMRAMLDRFQQENQEQFKENTNASQD
jgi:hypothetical protein